MLMELLWISVLWINNDVSYGMTMWTATVRWMERAAGKITVTVTKTEIWSRIARITLTAFCSEGSSGAWMAAMAGTTMVTARVAVVERVVETVTITAIEVWSKIAVVLPT